MNTEQKAKAYDEALEKARNFELPEYQRIMKELFPQLRESEDDEVRKAIIELVKQSSEILDKQNQNNMINWLEKQVSQDNTEDVDILHRFSFYSYKDEPNVLYLSGLYVNEECRNKGIGTKILEVADEVAKSLNCHAIRLKTKKDSNAERLYQTHGYNSLATEERDEIWLEKQGKEKSWKPSKEEMDVLYGLAYITNQYDEHKEEVITRLYQDLKREFFNGSSYENMFPNTSTEDDVRRRSTIQVLEYARTLDTYNQYGKADIDKNIAWVEKQKEYESTDFEYVWDRTDCGDLTSALDKYSEEAIINMCHAWYDKGIELERKSWLEKQDNLKSDEWKEGDVVRHGGVLALVTNGRRAIKSNCEQITIQYPNEWAKANSNERKYFFDVLEKQGERKPTDKSEPKFQNGQWIVWQNKCYKVNYNGCGYELIDQNGLSTSLEFGTVDTSARLWDITKDAKNGDVLYSPCNKLLWIFKTKDTVHCICNLNYNNDSICGEGYISTPTDTIPATKSQRDILFSKMKEEGYEWSEDTHELKKISQRTISAEAKETLYDKPDVMDKDNIDDFAYQCAYDLSKDWLYENASWDDVLIACKLGAKWYENHHKVRWSEKDEITLQGIIDEIQANKNSAPSYDIPVYEGFLNWLKQLKQRIGG